MADQEYDKLTVAKIRDLYKERGIPTTGLTRKQQLVDRLREIDNTLDTAPAEVQKDEAEMNAEEPVARASTPDDAKNPEPTEQSESKPPLPEAEDEDTRKRKRRSPTPVDEETIVQKRVRQEHEPEHAMDIEEKGGEPQPYHEESSEVPMEHTARGTETSESHVGEPSHAIATAGESSEELMQGTEPLKKLVGASTSLIDPPHADAPPPAAEESVPNEQPPPTQSSEPTVAPASHPATATLYIRNLKRPVRLDALRSHLQKLCYPPGAKGTPSAVTIDLWLDSLRTHAFARFPSVDRATWVRTNLHDTVWPPEYGREPLFVDFIADGQYDEFVEREEDVGLKERGIKRFEVWYVSEEGRTRAELKDMSVIPKGPREDRRRSSGQSQVKSAPAKKSMNEEKGKAVQEGNVERQQAAVSAQGGSTDTASFVALEQRFKSTDTKPIVYFQPVPQRLVDARKGSLQEAYTRRLVDIGGGSGLRDSRRYTFEEGGSGRGEVVVEEGRGGYGGSARLVDGGPEFGLRAPRPYRGRR